MVLTRISQTSFNDPVSLFSPISTFDRQTISDNYMLKKGKMSIPMARQNRVSSCARCSTGF